MTVKAVLVLCFGMLFGASCSGGADQSPPSVPASSVPGGAATTPAYRPARVKLPDFEVPTGRLRDALVGTSVSQAAILRDGKITFAEYESAVFGMPSCVKNAGTGISFAMIDANGEVQDVSGPVLDTRGRYQYAFNYPSNIELNERVISTCKTEYLDRVEFFWAEHVAPTRRDIDDARAALAACMRAGGEMVPENASREDFVQYLQRPTPVYTVCARRISDEFALPGFGGA